MAQVSVIRTPHAHTSHAVFLYSQVKGKKKPKSSVLRRAPQTDRRTDRRSPGFVGSPPQQPRRDSGSGCAVTDPKGSVPVNPSLSQAPTTIFQALPGGDPCGAPHQAGVPSPGTGASPQPGRERRDGEPPRGCSRHPHPTLGEKIPALRRLSEQLRAEDGRHLVGRPDKYRARLQHRLPSAPQEPTPEVPMSSKTRFTRCT